MSSKTPSKRITKTEWYAKGGLANSKLWRRQRKDGAWVYYEVKTNG